MENGKPSQISRYISVLYRYIQIVMAKHLEPMGIGMGQYAFILAVCQQPGITQDRLTSQLYYNKSSVARAIAQLEKNGFLRRETDPKDKRAYQLYPTDKGIGAKAVVLNRISQLLTELTEGFDETEAAQIEALLERMAGRIIDLRS